MTILMWVIGLGSLLFFLMGIAAWVTGGSDFKGMAIFPWAIAAVLGLVDVIIYIVRTFL